MGTDFLSLSEGTYVGDISLMLNLKSNIIYTTYGKVSRLFTLDNEVLEQLFVDYPEVENFLSIRAFKRLKYFKRVRAVMRINTSRLQR
jgi:hypothetical protein